MGDLMLASVGDDIRLWDSSSWNLVQQYNPHDHNVSAISWSCDGSIFGSVSTKDDKVSLNYVKNNTITTTELSCQPGRQCLDIGYNTRFLVTGGSDSIVSVWDLKGKKLKTSFKEHKGPVTCTQFNWNDSYIASGSESGEIILHNFVTGQSSSPLLAPKAEAIRQLQYNYYKKSLLGSASDDGSINLWDTNTRRLLHSFNKVHMAPATGLAFSPLNEMLMLSVGLDQKLVCYDLQGKRTLKTITADSPLTSVDIMHNGGTVAVGSTRGKIFIYDLRQGVTPVKRFSAHKSSVHCLKFQPNFDFKKQQMDSMKSLVRESVGGLRQEFLTHSGRRKKSRRLGPGSGGHAGGDVRAYVVLLRQLWEVQAHLRRDSFCGLLRRRLRTVAQEHRVGAQLPTAPQRNTDEAFSSASNHVQVSVPTVDRQLAGITSAAIIDVVSPLKEGDSTTEIRGDNRSDFGNRSGNLLGHSSHQNDSGQGVFSPISNNLGLSNASDTSFPRRQNFNERGLSPLVHSPMLHGQGLSMSSDGMPVINMRYQTNQDDGNYGNQRTMPNGHTEFESPTRRKHSPKGICASPSLPSLHLPVQSSADGAEGDVTDGRGSCNTSGDSPRSGRASSRVDTRLRSPSHGSPTNTQQLRHLVKEAVKDYSEQMQEELKAMFRKATQSPRSDSGPAASETSVFQTEFIRNLIREALEEFREDIHRDLQLVHLEMLRQFQFQQTEVLGMLEHHSVNRDLVAEVERLREENRRLKKNF
ncbi:protein NEDD1-like [Haliotis rubra]|uniref:protein NEDD1-like n=1 Tax=Haliotis rubra TaxID=36100 RepID=UPI001EE56C36|nr:protein NEDD1-like [Haliotis rubra]